MPRIEANADDYAVNRQNIFFPGVTPDLDGQCVSLEKWFMAEMSDVPDPQAARGDARYVGHTLVNQGHADEVPFADRRRGDIICYEYGTYGHIAVQLSGSRVFESNVNMPGVTAQEIDGAIVYASRIGSEGESWRNGKNPHVYRLKSYNEGGDIMPDLVNDRGDAINFIRNSRGESSYNPTEAEIQDAMTRTYKDWAYAIGGLNEGDAINMLNAQGKPNTVENRTAMLSEGFKHWMYNFSGRINNQFEEVAGPLFRQK